MVKTVVQDALKGLVDDLRATHGENLACVVLYGSAAAGDHIELRSDYNLLIALNRITPEDLRQAQAPMREWQRLGHPLPVYFTVEELSDAADVFPIEFHQMANARIVLYGHDPFEFAKLSDANLRHQTEYELTKQVDPVASPLHPRFSFDRKTVQLDERQLVELCGVVPGRADVARAGSTGVENLIAFVQTAKLLRLDPTPFERIFEFRASDRLPTSEKVAHEIFAAYMFQIEQVVEAVNKLDRRRGLGSEEATTVDGHNLQMGDLR